jgi:hypothetical protein
MVNANPMQVFGAAKIFVGAAPLMYYGIFDFNTATMTLEIVFVMHFHTCMPHCPTHID